MAPQPTEKEKKLYDHALEKVTNTPNEEDGCIDELKILFNQYRRTKNVEFKPGFNKYRIFKRNMKKKNNY